jgi:hypothetical protein
LVFVKQGRNEQVRSFARIEIVGMMVVETIRGESDDSGSRKNIINCEF